MKGPRGGNFYINRKGKKVYGNETTPPVRKTAQATVSRAAKTSVQEYAPIPDKPFRNSTPFWRATRRKRDVKEIDSDKRYERFRFKNSKGEQYYSNGYWTSEGKNGKIAPGDHRWKGKWLRPGDPGYKREAHESFNKKYGAITSSPHEIDLFYGDHIPYDTKKKQGLYKRYANFVGRTFF